MPVVVVAALILTEPLLAATLPTVNPELVVDSVKLVPALPVTFTVAPMLP